MIILKSENFNKYFLKTFLIIILSTLTSIPWIEFFNANLEELDFIFNNNLLILLTIYFSLIYSTYLILSFFVSLQGYSLVSFLSISTWILFQHNFFKTNLNIFFKNIEPLLKFSSEISFFFNPSIYLRILFKNKS